MYEMIVTLVMLLFAHALADFALQSEFIASAKNRHNDIIKGERVWPFVMSAHCAIHAGFVFLITQSIILFFAEFLAHFIIDYVKCDKKINFAADQFLHIGCKVAWVGLLALL